MKESRGGGGNLILQGLVTFEDVFMGFIPAMDESRRLTRTGLLKSNRQDIR